MACSVYFHNFRASIGSRAAAVSTYLCAHAMKSSVYHSGDASNGSAVADYVPGILF
jgi:hypothetical protein